MTDPPRQQSELLKSLRDRIACAEVRLAELAGEQAEIEAQLRELWAELASAETTEDPSAPVTTESAPHPPPKRSPSSAPSSPAATTSSRNFGRTRRPAGRDTRPPVATSGSEAFAITGGPAREDHGLYLRLKWPPLGRLTSCDQE